MQSRGPRLNDVLSGREVNEIADAPRGLTLSPQQAKEAEGPVKGLSEIARSVDDLTDELTEISQSVTKIHVTRTHEDGSGGFEKADRTKSV